MGTNINYYAAMFEIYMQNVWGLGEDLKHNSLCMKVQTLPHQVCFFQETHSIKGCEWKWIYEGEPICTFLME